MREASKWVPALIGLLMAGLVGPAHAQINGSATVTAQQAGPNSWDYSMSLTNTGSTAIGTYWFAWSPGYDFLPSAPTSLSAPAGWTVSTPQDGYFQPYWSIQWVNPTSPLQPGQTLKGFNFSSPDAPAVVGGPSFLGSFYPVTQSYVYIGAPEFDPGAAFTSPVTTVTPEPATLSIIALAIPALALKRHARRRPQLV
jgi:hypothetical protein